MKQPAAVIVVALEAIAAGCGSKAGDAGATCDSKSLLPVVQASIDNDATKLHIETVEIKRCRNGYAEVAAVPDNAACKPGVEDCYDTAQVFLHKAGDAWHVINVGTGITCENEQDPGFRRAYRALGYPG